MIFSDLENMKKYNDKSSLKLMKSICLVEIAISS